MRTFLCGAHSAPAFTATGIPLALSSAASSAAPRAAAAITVVEPADSASPLAKVCTASQACGYHRSAISPSTFRLASPCWASLAHAFTSAVSHLRSVANQSLKCRASRL